MLGITIMTDHEYGIRNSNFRLQMLEKPSLVLAPISIILSLWHYRTLILRLTTRELSAKWRGTVLGIFWSIATPLLSFFIYGFVFSQIMHSRWSGELENTDYSLVLFSGLVTFSIFIESVNRAPSLILENVSYVKKVIFPLEILAVVAVLVAVTNAGFGIMVLLAAILWIMGTLSWTILLVPLVLLPYCIFILGLTWILSSLGVFLRDVRQLIVVATSLLMFLTPVLYSVNSVPERYRWIIELNPLTPTLAQMRAVIFGVQWPDISSYIASWCFALVSASLGYFWFMRTRKAFADVI
jgi:lipopolysaccharide transport system permease protein